MESIATTFNTVLKSMSAMLDASSDGNNKSVDAVSYSGMLDKSDGSKSMKSTWSGAKTAACTAVLLLRFSCIYESQRADHLEEM